MGHTPGPWCAYPEELYVADKRGHALLEAIGIEGTEVDTANLVLAAAAPKMLAMLEEVRDILDQVPNSWILTGAIEEVIAGAAGSADGPPLPVVDLIRITPAEAFDLQTLAARVDDRSPSEQATLDRLARALEQRA